MSDFQLESTITSDSNDNSESNPMSESNDNENGDLTENGESNQSQNSLLKNLNSHKEVVREYITDSGVLLLREARKNNVDKVVDLLCRGAPFIADSTGVSPLHFAAFNDSIEITELLLNGGMLRDSKNKVDRTPLHIAAQKNHVNIVKALLTYGADPNVEDVLNMTPLHWAVENNNEECVRMLLQYGAKTTVIDNFGRSVEEMAKENNASEILFLLLNKDSIFQMNKSKDCEKMVVEENNIESIEIEYEQVENQSQVSTTSETPQISSFVTSDSQSSLPETPTLSQVSPSVTQQSPTTKPSFASQFSHIDKDTLEMFKQHGIQMLEPDKATTIHSAVQSGQKVVLTEAGKLALDTVSKSEKIKKTPIVIQNGGKCIKINTGKLTTLNLEQSKPLLKKVAPTHSLRYFEGKQYTEQEDEILKAKLQMQINKLRQEGKLLDIFAKRKFRQANIYNQQLLSLMYLKKKQPLFTSLPE